MRLKDKVALVVGGGQIPGETIGNGRATALLFAREGARLFLVDRDLASAEETAALIRNDGGEALTHQADVLNEDDCRGFARACLDAYSRIDVLHNNVGIGPGDSGATDLAVEAWDLIMDVNLRGMFLSCKHVLPAMRERMSGAIVNISSISALCSDTKHRSASERPDQGALAYKVSKAGVNALTESLASANAAYGIRVNAILPGLMDTPNAIEPLSAARGISRDALRRERDAVVPLGRTMGTAWDVAHAALFLASDEAGYITGVLLPVDGGQSARIG